MYGNFNDVWKFASVGKKFSVGKLVPCILTVYANLGFFLCRESMKMVLERNAMIKHEAHGPRFAHLSDIATADMQMLCNIFPSLSSQLMKISSFE